MTKRFGGITAVNDVSFGIRPGEIHAVVGENGAGKSTIMKMLAGVYQPDSGALVLRGEPVVIGDPLQARKLGVSIVFQELNLFPHLSVAGNIFANRETTRGPGLLDERQMVAGDEARPRPRWASSSIRTPRSAGSPSRRSNSSRSRARWSSSPRSSSWTSRTRPSAPPRRNGSSRCCAACGTRD